MLEEIQPTQVLQENKIGWGKYWEVCQGENVFLGKLKTDSCRRVMRGSSFTSKLERKLTHSGFWFTLALKKNLIEFISPGLGSPSCQQLRWMGTNMSRGSWEITSVLSFAGFTRWSSSIFQEVMWVSDENEVIEIEIANYWKGVMACDVLPVTDCGNVFYPN